MEEANESVVSELIFQGLFTSKKLQVFLFLTFFTLYLMSAVGNLLFGLLIITVHHLHSPMYFLKTISFGDCTSQILGVHFVAGDEIVLLVTTSYDCYVAICKPLHYSSIMDTQKCIWLVLTSWIIGLVHAISHMVLILDLPFCASRVVDSFFYDIPLVLKLACMNTDTLESLINADRDALAATFFILLLISYTFILFTVLLHSKGGGSKALSTCTSHMIVVVLTTWVDKFLAVFYTLIMPFLNPAIYTLGSRDIKNAMKKIINHM
uniref:G-protein coupled receptors family 1 profile domain-containing protein n=1 Tax=Nannospalax galili TaxID=1026970 RepID=A0A8C6QDK5_NANGA